MNIDETLLRAYVDGELDAATQARVAAALAASAELQSQEHALRASRLPYREAFDAQTLPGLPPALVARIHEMAKRADAVPAAVQPRIAAAPRRRQALVFGGAMAASFAAGMAVVGLRKPAGAEDVARLEQGAPWARAIASYHAMYVRETVDLAADAPARLKGLWQGFTPAQRTRLFVPDLQSAGLAFKRVQLLGFQQRPLIQMVYLPQQGLPAALCVLPEAGGDRALAIGRIEGQAVALWVRDGLAQVFVADMAEEPLAAVARRLIDGAYAPVLTAG